MPLWTASLVFWPQSTLPRLIASHEPSGARGTIRQLRTFAARFLHSTSAAHSTSPESTHLGCRMLASQCHLGQLGGQCRRIGWGGEFPKIRVRPDIRYTNKSPEKYLIWLAWVCFSLKTLVFDTYPHRGRFFQHKQFRDGVYVGMSARGRFSRSRPPSH